jgi:cytochrome P450
MNKYTELLIHNKVQQLEREGKMSLSADEKEHKEPLRVGFIEFLLSRENMTKDDLMASIIDLLFAGVDTTSNTMQWLLYMMAKNPDKQENLFQEVTSVLKPDELPTSKSLANMPYLKACLKETLRLYPAFSSQNRQIPCDMEILGYYLPKGSQITFLSYYMCRDENNFKDSKKFIPERWLRS